MSSSSFSQIRSQALNSETQTEALLSKYSQISSQLSQSLEPSPEENTIKQQIKDILIKRETLLQKLNRISESSTQELSTSKIQQIQRHLQNLKDNEKTFNKIDQIIKEERDRNNLLFSVQSDISNHKRRNNPTENEEINQDSYILEESQRSDNLNSIANRLLQGAYQTRDELINQRNLLSNSNLNIMNNLQSIPGLNVLISKINSRKKRDTLILAVVIAVCILLLFFV
ncbi:GOS1 [Candida pseudojiufengensis]|uniref:GOS1 n=1 Tax=Candida pseudojiufengensis TaxID=497109 RepID=UPI002224E73A|nr:GOS1 [Candida pseudojiufengensis]KAI5959810.1 GOS1 [Candida pseudojiufengensis]